MSADVAQSLKNWVGLITAGHHRTTAGQHRMDRWRSKVWVAYDPRKGVVLLTHAGCPYICGYMAWLCRHHDPFAASTLYLHKLIAWGQIVAESKFPPFVSCCPFPVLQIRVVSSPSSPVSMQLEPVTHVLVFDVNTTTIQGLGIRPTYSSASLLLSILTLLLLSSGCPAVSCAVLRCPAVFRPTVKNFEFLV